MPDAIKLRSEINLALATVGPRACGGHPSKRRGLASLGEPSVVVETEGRRGRVQYLLHRSARHTHRACGYMEAGKSGKAGKGK